MTIHYHGLPITPTSVLRDLGGSSFCVSWASRGQELIAHEIGQSVMHDNGAFAVWRKTRKRIDDWKPYFVWVEPLVQNAVHWAVIPDEIDAEEEVQDQLITQWPFGNRGAPVWHLNESIERLLRLADHHPRVCFGSTKEYQQVGSDPWLSRIDVAFSYLQKYNHFLPWVHMLRGMQTCRWGFPFASVDSTDVARNWSGDLPEARRGSLFPLEVGDLSYRAREMIQRWDAIQAPDSYNPRPPTPKGFFLKKVRDGLLPS